MTLDMLSKTKNDKILIRLTKKAGPDTKKLSQIVLDNAIAAEKRKTGLNASGSGEIPSNLTSENKFMPQVVIDRSIEPVTGTKRPNDQSNLPISKRPAAPPKPVSQASKPLALQNSTARRSEAIPQQKTTTTIINGTLSSANMKPKAPTTAPIPKPTTNIFSALSAAKRPGTSNAARAAAAAKEKAMYVVEVYWIHLDDC